MARLSETTFVLLDTETSGTDPAVHELLEVAAINCGTTGETSILLEALVRPTKPIPASASAVHHLVASDFERSLSALEVRSALDAAVPRDAVIVAHHSEFDKGFIAPALSDRRWLCSERLAHHLAPEAENFKNATLYYHLGGEKIRFALHGARSDLLVTKFVFLTLIECYLVAGNRDDIDALLSFASLPYVLDRILFGKHRGEKFDALPLDYLQWVLRSDFDADVKHTVKMQIESRRQRKVGVAS